MSRTPSSASATNLWSVLGLEPGASPSDLKRAFRQQARLWHPDLNGNDPVAEERFKAVNEAYAVLSDPGRRRQWEAGIGSDAGSAATLDPFATQFPDFDDYVAALLGRHAFRRRPQASVATADADTEGGAVPGGGAVGVNADDSGPRGREVGFGSRPPAAAPDPGGSVEHAPPPPPPVTAGVDCETVVDLTPEQALAGERVELKLPDGTVVEVWTPPLVGDGWRLRLAGVTPGGGDHFLQLRVRTDEGLRIDGLRVLYQLELAPADGALGCTAVVPTLDGPVQVRIPPGSSSGRLLRLRGRGLSHGQQTGDQLVEIRLVVPEALTEAEEALYGRLQQLALEERP